MVSWQAFPSLPPSSRASPTFLAPKTPFPFPFKRLPHRLRKMSLHSRVNFLKQLFKLKVQEMEYTFRYTNFRNHQKRLRVIKEQNLQAFVLRPMYLHVQK